METHSSDSEYSDTSGSGADEGGERGDEGSSTSSSSSSSSSSTNEESIVDDTTELAKIEKQTLRLPKGLCENTEIFKEFFSMNTWESLPSNFQAYLKNKYLPHFDENNEVEQEKTLRMLFNNEITRFNSSPLLDLQKNLEEGNYRPDVLKLRESIKKSKRREERFQECERISQLAKTLMISREKLLRSAYDAPPGTVLKIDRIINATPKMNSSAAAVRARKRFSEEIISIASQAGLNSDDLSDEDESHYVNAFEDIKMNRELMNQGYPNNETKIIGTMCRHKNDAFTIPIYGSSVLSDSNFKQVLMAHKKRKLEEPDRPEFETNDIRLRDVHARTQNSSGYKKLNVGRPLGRKALMKLAKQDQPDGIGLPLTPISMQQQTLDSSTEHNLYLLQNQLSYQQHQQQLYQQSILNSGGSRLLPSPMVTAIAGSIGTTIKQENSSDSEDLTPEPKLTPATSRRFGEEHLVAKKRNLPQPVHNRLLSVGNKGGSATKKMILSVNGTAVPETIQNLANVSMKDKSNTDLITLPQYGKVKAATLSDLEGIDMMHIPVDLDESGNIDILNDIKQEASSSESGQTTITSNTVTTNRNSTELMRESHICFLSLIRDIFCSTPNHRMKMDELKAKISMWLSNPVTALIDWYYLADNWSVLIPSAIHFLAGEFLDQPEDFVPYVEFKPQLNIYQWIGAGRDSDQHLLQLCNYWLNRRHEMGCKPLQKFELNAARKSGADYDELTANERPISPPPPRCPTNWTVRPATAEELTEFRVQERHRFENPHKAFTYRMHGYESVVGPVKGIYTQILSLAKARGHNMLTQDRPSYVTILTLVRDATARLPNGEGTRADICELLKSSQYISPDAQDNVLQTIVSGALDRMHTEHDPCVRYDTKRKIWIYLHRSRTEEEFERLHQEFQGIAKPKKVQNRKVKSKGAKIMQMISTAPPQSNQENSQQQQISVISNSSSPILNTSSISIITPNAPPSTLKLSPTSPQKTTLLTAKSSSIPKASSAPTADSIEQTDAEAAIDAQASPAILQKPQSFAQQSAITASVITDAKTHLQKVQQAKKASSSGVLSKPPLASPPVHSMQTVSSTVPTGVVGATATAIPSTTALSSVNSNTGGKQLTTILPNSSVQTVIAGGNQSQNNAQSNQINVGGKKITTKPILVSSSCIQNQSPSIVVSSQLGQQAAGTQQGFIIPININNSDQIKSLSTMPSALIAATNLNPKLIKSNQPPALTSTINARSAAVMQQGGKNFVRVATTTSQAGKSLINPQIAAANITLQQQKLLGHAVTAANIQQQHPQKIIHPGGIRTQIQKGVTATGAAITATAIKSNQPLTASQQKQILQNIITQQQKQQQKQQQNAATAQFNIGQNTVVLPSGSQLVTAASLQQNKSMIIASSQTTSAANMQQQQQLHKIITSSAAAASAGLTSTTVAMTGNPANATMVNNAVITNIANQQQQTQQTVGTATANLINPQIIQIHQTGSGGQATQITGKVQTFNATTLTAQQQQSLLQSIKQQQLKIQQSQQQQQPLIIKQQPTVFQQIQKSNPAVTPTTVSVSVGTGTPKNVVTSLMGANVSNLIATTSSATANLIQHQTAGTQQNIVKHQSGLIQQAGKTINVGTQPQTITRVIKSAAGTSIIQPQIISAGTGGATAVRTQAGNPVMAKVLTNPSGQIISLESLLQKQGIAPGTALRVTGTKSSQASLIQLAGTPGSPITQYAVVSQGRNLISVGATQRMITTQASPTNTAVVASLASGGNVTKVNEHKTVTAAAMNSQSTAQTSGQSKVITANQIQPLTAQQLVNAKVLGKAGTATGIRMVNASNLNIAHIRGKPVIIASKPTNATAAANNQQTSQNVILQSSGNNTNLVTIGGQTLKVQGNVMSSANVQVLNQSSSQPQTVVLGNQILKVQQAPHTIKQQAVGSPATVSNSNTITTTISSTNTSGNSVVVNTTNANLNQQQSVVPKTVVLGSTGQTIRVQSPQIAVQTAGTVSAQGGQPMILGTTLKGATMKGNTSGQQRVVLAVQGGGQILLPPGFQGGAINLKSLQGLKVVSIGQQQQQKGQSDEQRPVFAQIVTAPQAPRPPNPGGD